MAGQLQSRRAAQASLPALASTMARFDRATLEGFVEVAIAVLDCADGDPDIEEDDAAGQYDEDFYTGRLPKGYGPGWELSAPGGCQHDDREEEHE